MSPHKSDKSAKRNRRSYPEELKREAVQMYLDGHSASSIAQRLGLSNANLIYNWKEQISPTQAQSSQVDDRVRELQQELDRVRRERDVLKKALAIFSQRE